MSSPDNKKAAIDAPALLETRWSADGVRRFAPDHARKIAADFDLKRLGPDFYQDPFPVYHALRDFAPVKQFEDGSIFLTRYDDLKFVYSDAKTFSSDKKVEFKPKFGDSPLFEHHTTSLPFNDAPLHTRVRRLIAGAMTPRAIADMEPGLVRLVDELLEKCAARQAFDLIEDFACIIPIEVIGNLLNVPHDQRSPLRDWSLAILSALEPVISPEAFERGNRAVTDFLAYLRVLVADRRRHPGDVSRDVLTRLIQGEEGGEQLSEVELLQNCIFLLNAGHETTTNLIGNGLYALMTEGEAYAELREHPELIPSAIEEFLRFESSNQLGNRRATIDCEIGGVEVKAGTSIHLGIGAANRDPAQFSEPDRLVLSRNPNKHLAFAWGPHLCVGNVLARLEGRVAIGAFVRRFSRARLSGQTLRGGRARFRGFQHIGVICE